MASSKTPAASWLSIPIIFFSVTGIILSSITFYDRPWYDQNNDFTHESIALVVFFTISGVSTSISMLIDSNQGGIQLGHRRLRTSTVVTKAIIDLLIAFGLLSLHIVAILIITSSYANLYRDQVIRMMYTIFIALLSSICHFILAARALALGIDAREVLRSWEAGSNIIRRWGVWQQRSMTGYYFDDSGAEQTDIEPQPNDSMADLFRIPRDNNDSIEASAGIRTNTRGTDGVKGKQKATVEANEEEQSDCGRLIAVDRDEA